MERQFIYQIGWSYTWHLFSRCLLECICNTLIHCVYKRKMYLIWYVFVLCTAYSERERKKEKEQNDTDAIVWLVSNHNCNHYLRLLIKTTNKRMKRCWKYVKEREVVRTSKRKRERRCQTRRKPQSCPIVQYLTIA